MSEGSTAGLVNAASHISPPPQSSAALGGRRTTLAQLQVRVFHRTLTPLLVALGIILGYLVALFVAAVNSGNGVFGVNGAAILPVMLISFGVAMACMILSIILSIIANKRVQKMTKSVLAQGPVDGPLASAVLVRAVGSSRRNVPSQLLYVAHVAGQEVGSVIVPVPWEYPLPKPRSGAWLVMNPQQPMFASFCDTSFEQHQAAATDPALASPTRVQRGFAVPARNYWISVLITVAVAIVSWGVSTVALRMLA